VPAGALLVAACAYGAWRVREVDARAAAAPELRVGLVQGNLGLNDKRERPDEGLQRYLEQSEALERAQHPDLIVWPEGAYNYVLPAGPTEVGPAVTYGRLHTPLLFGALREEVRPDRAYDFNTAALVDARGRLLGTYDKTFLLLFGEWLPFGETFPGLYELSPNTGRFTPGSHQRALALGPWRMSILICYEDILPAFTRRAVREGRPHLLVNLTNDSWFGPSREPWIHLALSKLRAVEHHRYLLRSTVTGVSASIDPVGRLKAHGGTFARQNLLAEVRMLEGETVYERLGDWPGWLGLAAIAWMSIRARRAAA
jgi:apolipoprotein N-acyltransferase